MSRDYAPGIGKAVADRTINRKGEEWADVAHRVALGNSLLDQKVDDFSSLHHHLAQASTLMSGRHLQHGDVDQPTRPMEVFSNCGRFDTEIITQEHGIAQLGTLVGQSVTVRCADGQWRSAEAKAYGEQQLYHLVFRRKPSFGANVLEREVFFTRNHRWLLSDGTVTDNIDVGDTLAVLPGEEHDPQGVVHGLIFGDGTANKRRENFSKQTVSQGRSYASIRICKQDSVREDIHNFFDAAGYPFTSPPHAGGDRVYYVGKFPFVKEMPHTLDGSYIAGFIHGWWLADGSKTEPNGTVTISTCREDAAEWLVRHASYAGLTVVSHRVVERAEGKRYPNAKPLHIVRLRKGIVWELHSIKPSTTEVVYCVEEPVTKSFTLANGLVTGNCSTAMLRHLTFQLLLSGSGVGSCYDDDLMVVDWTKQPKVEIVIRANHPDVLNGRITGYATEAEGDSNLLVPDSREGWAKAIEKIETMTYLGLTDQTLVLDFSGVREFGAPIKGMQNRPASGPGPLMDAIHKVNSLRGRVMDPWEAAMWADHYLAECVVVGGARRAARISVKHWKDATIFEFIDIKRPREFIGKTRTEVETMRRLGDPFRYQSQMWSCNNSVAVDEEFYRDLGDPDSHASLVWKAVMDAQYGDGTGEPGFLNVHKLTVDDTDIEWYREQAFAGSNLYKPDPATYDLIWDQTEAVLNHSYHNIVNPCGEIVLFMLGGFCVIADMVPFHSSSDADALDSFRVVTRALMRVNLMDSVYGREVRRTNRIGVGMTGIHEYMWSRFGLGFRDAIAHGPYGPLGVNEKALPFWEMLRRFGEAVDDEAEKYSQVLGVNVPHTNKTMKPAGTTSKLFGLTEGGHLPAMRKYVRWVQFRSDDPLIAEYRGKGYPTRELKSYSGTTIVGFPTAPVITTLGMQEKLVTAGEATPEEQFRWLRLLEHYWLGETKGNQISYTLKYDPETVSFDEFEAVMRKNINSVRAVSVLPQVNTLSYEYVPEEEVTDDEYDRIVAQIEAMKEDVDRVHVDCENGACPIDFQKEEAA